MSALCATTTNYHIVTDSSHIALWMQSRGAVAARDHARCIGLERNGQLVAGTLYDSFNGASVLASIAIAGPITRRWLWAIFHYPFIHLGVNVLIGSVAEGNVKSRRLTEHLGFTLQTTIPQADPSGSLLLYVMAKEECRFLKRDYYE